MNNPQSRKPRHNSSQYAKPTPQIRAMAVSDANVTQEKQTKSEQQTKWYPFFKDSDNCYINDLALRAKRSPTHGAILQSKAVYTAGEDFSIF